MISRLVAVLAITTMSLGSRHAKAENISHESTRAAGWVVLGVGSASGAGSIVAGAIMSGEHSTETSGAALAAGGGVTLLLSLVIGIPLILTGDEKRNPTSFDAKLGDALAGRLRF